MRDERSWEQLSILCLARGKDGDRCTGCGADEEARPPRETSSPKEERKRAAGDGPGGRRRCSAKKSEEDGARGRERAGMLDEAEWRPCQYPGIRYQPPYLFASSSTGSTPFVHPSSGVFRSSFSPAEASAAAASQPAVLHAPGNHLFRPSNYKTVTARASEK